MRRQSFASNFGNLSGTGEPLIVVEESQNEEEADRRRNESPPCTLDPDSPTLNPYLLSPYRDTRKHSLPTPQCTSGITASQVRRLSERGGESSGPSPKQATFLATLSQAPGPQPGGRRHSVVTISKVPLTLFGRNRRESIAAFPMGNSRILSRRDSGASGISGPPSNSGSTHNLQLDIMDDIAHINVRKVRLKMWKTPSRERICEVQPLEGNSCSTQRYTQQARRHSEYNLPSMQPLASLKRRASEMPKVSSGIVCSNTDLISILSSLTSSATEINKCDDEPSSKDAATGKSAEQKRSLLKSFRSNSFDVSILHGAKLSPSSSANKSSTSSANAPPTNWFIKRHQPMSKKRKDDDPNSAKFNLNFDKYKVVKVVKETLAKTSSPTKDSESESRHKVVWDDASGTKVDAQAFGTAIEEFLTSQRDNDLEETGNGAGVNKQAVSPGKATRAITEKVSSWFSGGNKEEEKAESCEPSICSSLKDLFVK